MHHPSRAAELPELLSRLAALRPRVVCDPDPSGPPSPLRTAKLAWAAIEPGATHHVVFQDDIHPVAEIAQDLLAAVAARPDHGISLYVNWNSPQNSYLVRRSAALGSPWAPLSPREYTPTLGLVLPAGAAADLAAYLSTLPDHLRDDDEMVTLFCRGAGIPVVAAVPHLLDHGGDRSLAGNDNHGSRHATVFRPERRTGRGHWTPEPTVAELPARQPGSGPAPRYAVELTDSTCRIRFVLAGVDEPIEHPLGWYWYDWCALLGIDRDRVVDSWRAVVSPPTSLPGAGPFATTGDHAALGLELWAACYLLGADAAGLAEGRDVTGTAIAAHATATHAATAAHATPTHAATAARATADLARKAVGSWVASGLGVRDHELLGAEERRGLVELGMAALDRGWRDRAAGPGHRPGTRSGLEQVHA
ncbi:hypothetical protein [Streptomyces sp. NPDC056169]|uniref:hypothetical protein n=1 Tax=Streptomyces sp. NPDC056169 TaxID=3345734 RepID=UPI0035E23C46